MANPSEYLNTANVWTVLDLIVAEFQSDATSVACFDLRLVQRAIDLNRAHQTGQDNHSALDRAVGALDVAARDDHTREEWDAAKWTVFNAAVRFVREAL
jgi:hypothetical protein